MARRLALRGQQRPVLIVVFHALPWPVVVVTQYTVWRQLRRISRPRGCHAPANVRPKAHEKAFWKRVLVSVRPSSINPGLDANALYPWAATS